MSMKMKMRFQIPPIKQHTQIMPAIQMQPANLGGIQYENPLYSPVSSLQTPYVNPIVIGSIFQTIYQPTGPCSSCGR